MSTPTLLRYIRPSRESLADAKRTAEESLSSDDEPIDYKQMRLKQQMLKDSERRRTQRDSVGLGVARSW